MGSLNLMPGAIMNYELATPGVVGGGVNDLIEVNGDVTLDGTLNVSALAGFGIGKYRLMNYTGSLFNNVLDFGAMPGGGFAYQMQTAVAGRVSLLVGNATAGPDSVLGRRQHGWRRCGRRRFRHVDGRADKLDARRRQLQSWVGRSDGGFLGRGRNGFGRWARSLSMASSFRPAATPLLRARAA